MWQINNITPFAASMALFPNEDAVDTLHVIVKASFNMGRDITLADQQAPVVEADLYWGEPGKSSVKYASDIHTGKPATDIVMVGHACAPEQKEVSVLDVGLSAGEVNKTVRVFGNRQWRDGMITRPAPFTIMPMIYEKAYGGAHIVNGEVDSADARNPVGCGYAGKRAVGEMNGVPLPNLEDPRQLIRSHTDQPAPACFGFSAPSWLPRASFAGTYDEAWKKTRAPYLPLDFDKRFLNMAHPDLIYPGFLQGGEPVRIIGMHPRGAIEFDLPRASLVTRIEMAGDKFQPKFNLETLILEPNQLTFSMVWHAALPCDKMAPRIGEIKIALVR